MKQVLDCKLMFLRSHVSALSDWLSWLQEPPTVKQGGGAAPAGWPASGTITYENVTASYRPGLPPVLSNLSFTIQVSQSMPELATVMTDHQWNSADSCQVWSWCIAQFSIAISEAQAKHCKLLTCIFLMTRKCVAKRDHVISCLCS